MRDHVHNPFLHSAFLSCRSCDADIALKLRWSRNRQSLEQLGKELCLDRQRGRPLDALF